MGADELAAGREAYSRRAWAAARDHLARVELSTLEIDDLHSLATAAYLAGDRDTAIRGLQRAHTLLVESGERRRAARDAHELAIMFATGGEPAVGAGWVARANRLLEGEAADCVERGYLLMHEMFAALAAEDFAAMAGACERIQQIARTRAEPDLMAFGLVGAGRALLYQGQVADGLARLDESMVVLTTEAVSPIMAGHVYCAMIEGCQEVADYERMAQWADVLDRWCDTQPGLVAFIGQSAVHRAQILRSHGAFRDALDELALAVERYAANGQDPAVGLALYERGEVLRTIGDLDGADKAFDAAATWGYEPQPGLALLALARGQSGAAAATMRRLLEEAHDPVTRSRRLAAAVEVFLAAANPDHAQEAAAELAAIAETFGCPAVTAAARYATGLAELARQDPTGSLTALREAWQVWIRLGCRYEAARARVRMALALRALGDELSATSELNVARRTFAELGAEPARRQVDRLLGSGLPDGLTAREVEVLRLVADGQSNPQIAAILFLSEKTVARHLSNIFTKAGVTSRTAAAAYARRHDLA